MDVERNCGNCACVLEVTVGEGADAIKHHVCRLNPPVPMQQRRQGQVMTTGRGEQVVTVATVLAYPPTVPTLVCWQWRPRGLQAGEDIATNPTLARLYIDQLQASMQDTGSPAK